MTAAPSGTTEYDYIVKILLIGDSGTGKTALLRRFVEDAFSQQYTTTIGWVSSCESALKCDRVDFKVRTIEISGKRWKIQLWDTAAYYRRADGVLLVYDCTSPSSFASINQWIANVDQHAQAGTNKMLIASKCDLIDAQVIHPSKGEALAKEYSIPFVQTSAKSSLNVDEAIIGLTKEIKKRVQDQRQRDGGIEDTVLVGHRHQNKSCSC
ncbi:Rab GTPase [Planoprotostelium fungivorum]|uniref:Rab GTPase n=1 Tax=Planoprotostelium fungivorum TaxID=1890364 RepID=A0A2P6N900_9EUKA|nr:Rab GTPase [Planoprotostelium fungivorum]